MLSPARRHFIRASAAKSSAHVQKGKQQTGEQYELMAAAMWEARQTLKNIKSIEAKINKKRELLPQFVPYLKGVLEAGNGAQDDVLLTCMVWCFDIGDLDGGLDIAEYAIKHNLQTPDRYSRDTASLVAEQVAEQALQLLAGASDENRKDLADALIPELFRTLKLTDGADMHDQISAKLHKATGYVLREIGETENAISMLQRALKLNDRVGVKKDIENLERQLKKEREQQNAG